MAKLSGLIEAMSRLTGFPYGTVALVARHLREAGLIKSGGRGPGAAEMNCTDAANLLLGVAGTVQVVEAVDVVRLAREAVPQPFEWGNRVKFMSTAVVLPGLPQEAPFGVALDAVIQRLAETGNIFDTEGNSLAIGMDINRTIIRTARPLRLDTAFLVDPGQGNWNRFYYNGIDPFDSNVPFGGLKRLEIQDEADEPAQRRSKPGIRISCHVDPIVIHGVADLIAGRDEAGDP